MTLLLEGVLQDKYLLAKFKATIRAIGDTLLLDVPVEEALLLGIPNLISERLTAIKGIMQRMEKKKSISRILVMALIAFKALSPPSLMINGVLQALIKTEKYISEIKNITGS